LLTGKNSFKKIAWEWQSGKVAKSDLAHFFTYPRNFKSQYSYFSGQKQKNLPAGKN
jgi:hypothetical protein